MLGNPHLPATKACANVLIPAKDHQSIDRSSAKAHGYKRIYAAYVAIYSEQ